MDTVKLLLGRGAEIGKRNNSDMTALLLAAREGYADIVRLLLDRKAAVEVKCQGWTALMFAPHKGNVETVKLLLDHDAKIDTHNNVGMTELLIAVREGHADIVKLLLEHNAAVEPECQGSTPLMVAAEFGHVEILAHLLSNGADVHRANNSGYFSLAIATHSGHEEAVQLLISHGADVNFHRRPSVDTAINVASGRNKLSIAKRLLKVRCSISIRNENGCCALNVAARYGHPEMIDLLLSSCANVSAKCPEGFTSLQQAIIASSLKKTEDLDRLPNEPDLGFDKDSQQRNYVLCAKSLLDWDADSKATSKHGRVAIHYTAYVGDEETLKLLLDEGADPGSHEPGRGWTSLHHVASRGHHKCVDLLIEHEADACAKTKDGESYEEVERKWSTVERSNELQDLVFGEIRKWV